jgi:hypothetical protein
VGGIRRIFAWRGWNKAEALLIGQEIGRSSPLDSRLTSMLSIISTIKSRSQRLLSHATTDYELTISRILLLSRARRRLPSPFTSTRSFTHTFIDQSLRSTVSLIKPLLCRSLSQIYQYGNSQSRSSRCALCFRRWYWLVRISGSLLAISHRIGRRPCAHATLRSTCTAMNWPTRERHILRRKTSPFQMTE